MLYAMMTAIVALALIVAWLAKRVRCLTVAANTTWTVQLSTMERLGIIRSVEDPVYIDAQGNPILMPDGTPATLEVTR